MPPDRPVARSQLRSEEHTSELRHLVISYAVFCLKKKILYRVDRACRKIRMFIFLRAPSKTLSLQFFASFSPILFFLFFFFNDTPTTEIYTLSLHDALPIRAS